MAHLFVSQKWHDFRATLKNRQFLVLVKDPAQGIIPCGNVVPETAQEWLAKIRHDQLANANEDDAVADDPDIRVCVIKYLTVVLYK